MQPFEAVVIVYLTFFAIAAPFARVAPLKRVAAAIGAAAMATGVYVVTQVLPIEIRLWLPFLYIAIGYWIPVPLVPSTTGGTFEAWLRRTDAALRRRVSRLPRWPAWGLELGYLACFPLVPVSFAVVSIAGSPDDVARYWLGVLLAGYACYITLPWLVSRPPRLLEESVADVPLGGITRLNRFVLGHVSHRLNTFPSGHVAVSVAAAIGAGHTSPLAGVVFGAVAAAVAVGAVAGRYHYLLDVVVGAAIGAAVSL